MPNSVANSSRSRALVAGEIRSTMPFGNATLFSIQSARPGSDKRANPATALRVTSPLCGMLSQDMTVNASMPAL